MSDFLTHLIDRAAGRAALLERRPRALFEPAQPGGAAAPEVQQQEVEEHLPRAAPPQREGAVDVVQGPAGGEAPSAAAALTPRPMTGMIQALPVQRQAPIAVPASAERISPAAPPQVPPSQTVLRSERITRVVDAAPPPASAAPAAAMSPGDIRSAKAAAVAAKFAPAATRRTEREERPAQVPPPRVQVVEPRGRSPSAPAARPQRPAATAVLIAKAQAVPKAPVAAVPAPPAPVQISIGRVEVRAHGTAEPRPRPAATAAPKLKLEDYLRQRSGGGQ